MVVEDTNKATWDISLFLVNRKPRVLSILESWKACHLTKGFWSGRRATGFRKVCFGARNARTSKSHSRTALSWGQ